MKKAITLSIKSPCAQKWESFTPSEHGGFCHSCQKTVVDMTKMSERELLEYLRTRTSSTTCARMRKDQLISYDLSTAKNNVMRFGFVKAAIASALLLLLGRQGYAQTKVSHPTETVEIECKENKPISKQQKGINISGRVLDEYRQPLPGVNVVLRGGQVGTITDSEGYFSFPETVHEGQTLLFSFIGFMTQEYVVIEKGIAELQVNMIMDEYLTLGELTIDQPYAIEAKKTLWSRIKGIF